MQLKSTQGGREDTMEAPPEPSCPEPWSPKATNNVGTLLIFPEMSYTHRYVNTIRGLSLFLKYAWQYIINTIPFC